MKQILSKLVHFHDDMPLLRQNLSANASVDGKIDVLKNLPFTNLLRPTFHTFQSLPCFQFRQFLHHPQ